MAELRVMACCGMKEIAGLTYDYAHINNRATGAQKVLRDILVSFWRYASGFKQLPSGESEWYVAKKPYLGLPCAHFIFTEAHQMQYRYGWRLAKYIRQHNLGTVICTKQAPNRNYLFPDKMVEAGEGFLLLPYKTGTNKPHMITAFIWTPNYDTLYDWCLKYLPKPSIPKKPY